MPKIVDHEQRRASLGAAVRRVIARDGVEAATVRAVAAEAGWSMGALRYYFTTQSKLLDFAVDAMLADIPVRLEAIIASQPPGRARALRLLEELLPLDEDRRAEVRVYLAFMARVGTSVGRPELAEQTWLGERHICAWAIADVTGVEPPSEVGVVPHELERAVDELQVFVDGLSFLGATIPAQLTPEKARALLAAHLDRLSAQPSEVSESCATK